MHATEVLSPPSTAERACAHVKGEILARRWAAHELLAEGRLAGAVDARLDHAESPLARRP